MTTETVYSATWKEQNFGYSSEVSSWVLTVDFDDNYYKAEA